RAHVRSCPPLSGTAGANACTDKRIKRDVKGRWSGGRDNEGHAEPVPRPDAAGDLVPAACRPRAAAGRRLLVGRRSLLTADRALVVAGGYRCLVDGRGTLLTAGRALVCAAGCCRLISGRGSLFTAAVRSLVSAGCRCRRGSLPTAGRRSLLSFARRNSAKYAEQYGR